MNWLQPVFHEHEPERFLGFSSEIAAGRSLYGTGINSGAHSDLAIYVCRCGEEFSLPTVVHPG